MGDAGAIQTDMEFPTPDLRSARHPGERRGPENLCGYSLELLHPAICIHFAQAFLGPGFRRGDVRGVEMC